MMEKSKAQGIDLERAAELAINTLAATLTDKTASSAARNQAAMAILSYAEKQQRTADQRPPVIIIDGVNELED